MPFNVPLSLKPLAYQNLTSFIFNGIASILYGLHLRYFAGNGKLYCHDANAGASKIYESSDGGFNWVTVLTTTDTIWGLDCSNNLLLAAGASGNIYISSTGGAGSWTTVAHATKAYFDVTYSSTNNLFYLCDANTGRMNSTVDGTIITVGDQAPAAGAWHNSYEHNGRIVCLDINNIYTFDGNTFVSSSLASTGGGDASGKNQVVYNPDTNIWLAIGTGSANYWYSTDNALTWIGVAQTPILNNPSCICYSPTLKKIMGYSGSFKSMFFTTDAVNFTYTSVIANAMLTTANEPRSLIEYPGGITSVGGAVSGTSGAAIKSLAL